MTAFLAVYVIIGGANLAARYPGLLDLVSLSPSVVLPAVGQVAIDVAGENPRVGYDGPPGSLPICRNVESRYLLPLQSAFALMRGTDEGQRLFATLVDHGVCVGVTDIPYNGGFSSAWEGAGGDWSRSTVMIDNGYLRSGGADALAAILVHEASHIDRAVRGIGCGATNDCTRLPNGVDVEEEMAAHAAEAEWWIAAFGRDGKRFAFGPDYGENRLVKAYLRGPDAFRTYVVDLRSDPREGEGI